MSTSATSTSTPEITESAAAASVVAAQNAGGPARVHLSYVDGLRGLAALYVMFGHTFTGVLRTNESNGFTRILGKFTAEMHFAVTIFIVVSGFCLMLPALASDCRLKGGKRTFFLRRYLRIAPPFYAATILTILLLQVSRHFEPDNYAQATWSQAVAHLLLVHVVWPNALLSNNGVLWSISTECIIYLFFPLLLLLWRSCGWFFAAALFLLMGISMVIATRGTFLAGMSWHYLGAFAIGAAAADIAVKRKELSNRLPAWTIAVLIFASLAAFSVIVGWPHVVEHLWMWDLPVAFAAGCVLVAGARTGPNWGRDFLSARPFVTVGLFSYSLYMIHYPLAYAIDVGLIKRWPIGMNVRLIFSGFIVLPLLLISSYCFYRLFEVPSHQLSRRRAKRSA